LSKTNPPFFSVIIATKNISNEFHNTLKSILIQKFKSYEIILIDSSDNEKSKKIINEYSSLVDHFLDKGDKGIYDAWNQGLSVSMGKWIVFLGSGDILTENSFGKVHEKIKYKDLDLLLTNINLVSKDSYKFIMPQVFNFNTLSKFIQPPHPGIFHNKKVFIDYGKFNDNYKIAGDYEFLLRIVEKANYEILDIISVEMLAGGVSQSLKVVEEGFKIQYLDKRFKLLTVLYNCFKLVLKLCLKKFIKHFQ
jgi:glycosyltransferase involved in cell wall biosynthesis